MLCDICDELSVEVLVKLFVDSEAKRTAPYYRLPDGAWLPHHSSYDSLVTSAKNGCDFCNEIWTSCKLPRCRYRQGDGDKTRDFDSVETVLETLELDQASEETGLEICVASSHINITDSKTRLDALIVRVGNFDLVVEFKLTCPVDEAICFGEFKIGRYDISPDLGSDANFNTVKGWLTACREKHRETCLPTQPTVLPDRILDVVDLNVSGGIRLLETGGGIRDIYLTLSHSWGDAEGVLKTTSENLTEMTKHIEFSSLPRTFQDAVTITCKLGYRYLWIDSLCILQDSREDWEIASAKMGDIYQNSALTIAASVSTDSDGCMLHSCEPEPVVIVRNALRVDAGTDSPRRISIRRKDIYEEQLIDGIVKSHLATRAWALQEQYLPERVLFYGKRQLYWQCPALQCAADGEEPSRWNEKTFQRWGHVDNDTKIEIGSKEHREVYGTWYTILEQYSKRNLTISGDKLPALSGLAAQFAKMTGDKYMAGIWEWDVMNGLIWRCEAPKKSRRPQQYRAPTWSWAALDAEISRPTNDHGHLGTVHDAELSGWDVKISGRDSFGSVESACITLSGYSWPLLKIDGDISKAGIEHDVYFGHPKFDVASEGNKSDMCDAYFDTANQRFVCGWNQLDGEGVGKVRAESLTILLVRLIQVIRFGAEVVPSAEETDAPHFNTYAHYGALILRRVPGENELYERVGYLSMYCTLSLYSKAWTKKDITIV